MMTMPMREWTVEDLAALPDDGLRYELVDGVLLVSAAPSDQHQLALTNLVALLVTTCPLPMRTLVAPVDVRFSQTRQLQPDLLVLPELDLTDRDRCRCWWSRCSRRARAPST